MIFPEQGNADDRFFLFCNGFLQWCDKANLVFLGDHTRIEELLRFHFLAAFVGYQGLSLFFVHITDGQALVKYVDDHKNRGRKKSLQLKWGRDFIIKQSNKKARQKLLNRIAKTLERLEESGEGFLF